MLTILWTVIRETISYCLGDSKARLRFYRIPHRSTTWFYLCRNGDLNLDTSLDVDDNLLDDFGRSIET
jgi:hypothetical protein